MYKKNTEKSENLNVREMAEFMGIGRRKSYEIVHAPGFPSFRIGNRILVNKDRLERWIDEQIAEKGCY